MFRKQTPNQTKSDKYQQITDKLISLLEQGTIPWKKCWSSSTNAFQNPLSGTAYRGINPLLLAIDCAVYGYSTPYFASFNQATENGWKVIKGSKASSVTWAAPVTKQQENEQGETETSSYFAVKWFNVFNFDCFDDSEAEVKKDQVIASLGEVEVINPDQRDDRIDKFFKATAIAVEYIGDQPCYIPSQDKILMPSFENFSGKDGFYSTYFHETVHATGHQSRLNRDMSGRFGSQSYSKEELIAEIGAAFLGNHFNLSENLLENHASYLDSWIQVLKGDNKAFFKAARSAQQAVDYLLELTGEDK